jgi:protein-S-isoprenylcysteine O-methyltransferase Ste14
MAGAVEAVAGQWPAVAFAAIVRRVHIPFEEAQLRRAFGGWYSDYAATVRRWL